MGAQNWFDAVALHRLLRAVGPMVTQTLLPVLRLVSGDPERIDRDYARLVAQREPRSRVPSLAQQQRQLRSLVEEMEWVCAELRHHMSMEQYEALVSGTAARALERHLAHWLPRIAHVLGGGAAPVRPESPLRRLVMHLLGGAASGRVWRGINPVSFLVGPLKVRHWSAEDARGRVRIEKCRLRGALTSGEPARETCQRLCKGALEAVCGQGDAVELHLSPLPSGACDVTIRLQTAPGQPLDTQRESGFVPEAALLRGRERDSRLWN